MVNFAFFSMFTRGFLFLRKGQTGSRNISYTNNRKIKMKLKSKKRGTTFILGRSSEINLGPYDGDLCKRSLMVHKRRD